MSSDSPPRLPRATSWMQPLITAVARIPASVHTKLLGGFLFGALLLVAMAALSLAVQSHIAARIDELDLAQERLDRLRQMQYLITAQSHYRTMSLLTHDDSNVDSIGQAKAQFLVLLDEIDATAPPSQRTLLARIREANQRFAVSSDQVLQLYRTGQNDQALRLHLSQEHPISHEIEAPIANLLDQAEQQMAQSQVTVRSDQQLLTYLFIGFSVGSLLVALLLGFVLSWSFLLPLRTVHRALARIAAGHFDQRIELANQDEFGSLARNLNATSQELAVMYGQLESLNAQLRGTNTELLGELQERIAELARSRTLVTESEERVRRELAEVLHSRVQNRLLMVWYRLEELQSLMEADPASARELLNDIRDQVDQIREQDVRELSHRLHPSIIRAGLMPALETLAEETEAARVVVNLEADPHVIELDHPAVNGIPDAVRLTAYRVVEEALGNVVKHANATNVQIHLSIADDGLNIEVHDDGCGFDRTTLQAGLGIGSIAAHVGRVAGSWSIQSAPGAGTRLSVVLPCSVEQMQHGLGREVAFGHKSGAESTGGYAIAGSI